MRHYFFLLVFGLILSEALSLEIGKDHIEPENTPDPFNQNLDDRDEDLVAEEENMDETRDAASRNAEIPWIEPTDAPHGLKSTNILFISSNPLNEERDYYI